MVGFINPTFRRFKNNEQLLVTNRSGNKEAIDISQIRKVLDWAIVGLDVNVIELEAKFETRLNNKITTRQIQDNLIDIASSLTSIEQPDWRLVAGRLLMWSIHKEASLIRKGQDFASFVKEKTDAGIYNQRLAIYTQADLQEAQSWLNHDWDKDYDLAGVVLLQKRYLKEDEFPQEAWLIDALILASVHDAETRLTHAKAFYEAITQRKLSLATPMMANLRFEKGSVTSCFITSVEDNLESIYAELTNVARISKNGGGSGVNVSKIRATGSSVMGNKNASGGVIPWLKLFNDTATAVNQGGRRAGAVTVSLDVWHLDVPEFLEMQTENGDQRRKVYDVFPQLVIPDEFMRRVENKEDWTLIDPYEVKTKLGFDLAELWGDKFEEAYHKIESALDKDINLYKKVNARELFKEIMRSQVETGMPYLSFKDAINQANPNQHEGYIPGTNLCVESFSNVKSGQEAHCCNLISLNLANIEDTELESMCTLAVTMLDNSIEVTTPPFQEAKSHNNKYRTIGVGAMGLADWLAKRSLNFLAIQEIDSLFEDIAYYATKASYELALDRGAYPAFEGSEWSKGNLLGAKPIEFFDDCSKDSGRWHRLRNSIVQYGIRNSHITAIAPNTSSSLVQGCTASILPLYKKFFFDKWAKGVLPIVPPYIREKMWFYQENINLDQKIVIDVTATIQKWIDTGISMELIFNLNDGVYNRTITAKDIYDLLIRAWRSKIKAIYYVRTIQRDTFKSSDDCSSCAN
jgi:ribonucleoside-diphosphate reductase alpha chain